MHRHLLTLAVFFATACSTFALVGIVPVLTNSVRSGDQFQFTLRGETNVSYIIESSSNLSTWSAAVTNSDLEATRTVIVPATGAQGFWRVRPMPSPLFEYAVLARGTIQLGGTGRIDSFDSRNPSQSGPNGSYDPLRATDRALVATTSRAAGALSVGNTMISGSVGTGPGGTVTVGPSGTVGDRAYNSISRGTIQPGHWFDDVRVVLPPATLPRDFAPQLSLLPSVYPVNGTNYKYAILSDGDFRTPSISLGAGEKMLITARARIYVTGTTTITGSNSYILLGRDASVEWYAGGVVSLGGGACINSSSFPQNFAIISLANAPVSYQGGVPLIGTIYAPLSTVTMNGTTDMIGAIVCSNFSLFGTLGIHFDESLKREGPFL
jgi:hypothetical protein